MSQRYLKTEEGKLDITLTDIVDRSKRYTKSQIIQSEPPTLQSSEG
jgi:hypothetical protein